MSEISLEQKQAATKEAQESGIKMVGTTRWFVAFLLTFFFLFISVMYNFSSYEAAQENTKVVWFKMFPDGSWESEVNPPEATQDFFQTTIDSMLNEFVQLRYSKDPTLIKYNYGKALIFMSDAMKLDFVSKDKFNAPRKAMDLIEDKGINGLTVELSYMSHGERKKAQIKGVNTYVYSTNVYVYTQERHRATGQLLPDTKQREVIELDWRILPKEELSKKSEKYLLSNPIGLEVVAVDRYHDNGFK